MGGDFVGRPGELRFLEAAWLAAGDGGAAPVIVVYGESGIGREGGREGLEAYLETKAIHMPS